MFSSRTLWFQREMQSSRRSPRRQPAPRCPWKPRLEVLEDRTLLATFARGDVFLSTGAGVEWRHADGALVQTLSTGLSLSTGSAFDAAGNFYVTDFTGH